MDLFGLKAKQRAMQSEMNALSLAADLFAEKAKYRSLLTQWNALCVRINKLGGEGFLVDAENKVNKNTSPFTREEINFLIRAAHPDRNGNDAVATSATQKLLSMRTKK